MRTKGSKKTGGREKGTPNKVTTDLKLWINELLNDNREQFIRDLKLIDPKQRVMIFEKLLSYAVPKMQSVEAKINFETLSNDELNTIIENLESKIGNEN
jgi:hypothetical protein